MAKLHAPGPAAPAGGPRVARASVLDRLGQDGINRLMRELVGEPGPGGHVRCAVAPEKHSHGDATPSMKANYVKGGARCYGCGWSGGLLDLAAAVWKLPSRAEAAAEIERRHLGENGKSMTTTATTPTRRARTRATRPAPDLAKILAVARATLAEIVRLNPYTDIDILAVLRATTDGLTRVGGGIERLARDHRPPTYRVILPMHLGDVLTGVKSRPGRIPGRKSHDEAGGHPGLLGAATIAAQPSARVLLLEGEHDLLVAASHQCFDDYALVAVPGSDTWKPAMAAMLRGRDVTLLPHRDPEGAGLADREAADLFGVASAVRRVDLDDAAAPAGAKDLADLEAAASGDQRVSDPGPLTWERYVAAIAEAPVIPPPTTAPPALLLSDAADALHHAAEIPPAGQGPRTAGDYLQESGLDALHGPEPAVVERGVRRLAAALARDGADAVTVAAVRAAAIGALGAVKFKGACRLLDAALSEIPAQPEPAPVADVVPWAGSVNVAALLDSIVELLTRFMVLPAHAAATVALWIVAAHGHAAWEIFASLGITSPTKRCGKSRLLKILAALLPRPLVASSLTAAVVFRAIEKWRPSLLFDEAEGILNKKDADPELRGILNAGFDKAGASVLRCVGDAHDVQAFSVWAPRAYALIGALPETLRDRSINVPVKRKPPTAPRVRMRERDLAAAGAPDLARQAARWATDNLAGLTAADPQVPTDLDDRAADGWASLLAVADLAGGTWPTRARAAALALCAERGEDEGDADVGVRLLRAALAAIPGGQDVIATADLCIRLNADPSGGWGTWNAGKGIGPRDLGRLLGPHGIKPKSVRLPDGRTPKGYTRADLTSAAARYPVPDPVPDPVPVEIPPSDPPQAPHEWLDGPSPTNTHSPTSATNPIVAEDGNRVNRAQSPNGSVVADVADETGGSEGGTRPAAGFAWTCPACRGRAAWTTPRIAPERRCRSCHPPTAVDAVDVPA